MKWVVTGGTGFIGAAVVRELRTRGEEVVVLSREARAEASGVRYAAWTPGKDGPWTRELDGAFAVVHLAGAGIMDARWTPERKREIKESRVVSTELLAEAMARAEEKPRVFVSGSAVGIYGGRLHGPDADEELEEGAPHGADFLAQICEAWEAAAEPARSAGVRVVHPRIGVVLGKGGGALVEMARPFRAFVGGPLGDGGQWVSWIHLDDAVAALLFPASATSFTGPYNVTAPRPVTQRELARALGAAMHRPAILPAPAAAIRLALGERADAVLLGQRVVPRRLEAADFTFRYRDIDSALKSLFTS